MPDYYHPTSSIISMATELGKLLGRIEASNRRSPSPTLRKSNQIKTIQASLAIEGNTMTVDQVTAIVDNKRVAGPAKDIIEVKNAINVYDSLHSYDAFSEVHYLTAHKTLMAGLVNHLGKYRTSGVGVVKGNKVAHLAPPTWNVPFLMRDLFSYLKDHSDSYLIKSCVFHYEMEFIHPFLDGNGRMGRLWQTLILMLEDDVFAYLPVEELIRKDSKTYYEVLAICDKEGHCTKFVEYMLSQLIVAVNRIMGDLTRPSTSSERLQYFINQYKDTSFTRKDYLNMLDQISTATASRDLRAGVQSGLLTKSGDKRRTIYTILEK